MVPMLCCVQKRDNRKSFLSHPLKSESGVTLIEVCILIVLVGLLMLPLLNVLSLQRYSESINRHFGTPNEMAVALVDYALEHGAYPLPAGPTLPLTNTAVFNPTTTPPAACTDNGAANASGVICRPRISGDTDITHRVYVGTVPVSVLGLPPEKGLDEYGHKFTYIITKDLTATLDNSKGAVVIANTDATATWKASNAHFAVISHGKDGIGAYSAAGTLIGGAGCPGTYESGNPWPCKSGPGQRAGFARAYFDNFGNMKGSTSDVNNAIHYDDSVAYKTTLYGRLWTPRDDAGVPNEYFTAGRNVGVGYANYEAPPSDAFTIKGGNLRATNSIKTKKVCDQSGNCFSADDVATPVASSPPLYCGSSYALRRVPTSLNVSACSSCCETYAKRSSTSPLTTCPNGINKINTSGAVVCAP